MLSANARNMFEKLTSLLTESDMGVVPRLIVVNENSKDWRQTVINGVTIDKDVFHSDDFVINCKWYLDDELQEEIFKGSLQLALHNMLTAVIKTDSMIVTVQNKISKFWKGRKVERDMKLVYIVLYNETQTT